MKIGVLGTGVVGQTLAGKLHELGHDVMMGSRDAEKALARTLPGQPGSSSLSEWRRAHPAVRLSSFAEAASHGTMIVNATSGAVSLDALRMAGAENLDGKVLLDVSNPLDFSHGMPPSLSLCNTDSAGEQIQRAFPRARVVKALNTVTAALMVNPSLLGGGDHTLFICGNDAGAKAEVTALLRDGFGWRDVMDLGDIGSARGMEMYLPIWLRMWGAIGTGIFNVRVVRTEGGARK